MIRGKLITWQGTVREFGMIGPNLSHVRVTERSAQGRMRLQIDSYLPRSNSINRSYFAVKLEVLEDVGFQRVRTDFSSGMTITMSWNPPRSLGATSTALSVRHRQKPLRGVERWSPSNYLQGNRG